MTTSIFVAGYRRTGKDTFYNFCNNNSEHTWQLYSENSQPLTISHPVYRRAFADALKTEVAIQYNIPEFIPDTEKDTPQFNGKSARDYYIEWAAYRRSQNPDYWRDIVLNNLPSSGTTIITDWRYPNELSPAAITVRVFRSQVLIPEAESEHYLDSYKTDYLAVPNHCEFLLACKNFPQYRNFKFSEIFI